MLYTNVSGTWKQVQNISVNVGGGYKQVPQIYVNVNGTWKPLFSFSWEQGSWSECSAECGGGTQQRTVRCKRNDGTYWPDSVCSSVGTKPETTQSCNTQDCTDCRLQFYPDYSDILVGVCTQGTQYVFMYNGKTQCIVPEYNNPITCGFKISNKWYDASVGDLYQGPHIIASCAYVYDICLTPR